MIRWLALLAVAALALLCIPASGPAGLHPSTSPDAHVVPDSTFGATMAQLTASATQNFYRVQTFDQNGSSIYDGSSTRATFPVNFSGYSAYSSVQGSSISFSVTTSNSFVPQINVTQGGSVLANGSANLPFTLSMNGTSGVSVTDRVVELYSSQNALPNDGHYGVFTNASQVIQFTYLSQDSWGYNSTAYAANYSITSPGSYALSNIQLFLPFPSGVTPNFTTVLLQQNGVSQTTFVVEPGGISFGAATLAAGKTEYVDAEFQPEPNLGGASPMITLRSYQQFNGSYYVANGTWVNNGQLAYAGQYVLTSTFSFPFLASTMNLYDSNGLLSRNAYSVSGNTITVLPLVQDTPATGVAFFVVYFQFLGAPPSLELAKGSAWLSVGGLTITWGNLLAVLAVITVLSTVLIWLGSPQSRKHPRILVISIVIVVALAGAYVGLQPVGL